MFVMCFLQFVAIVGVISEPAGVRILGLICGQFISVGISVWLVGRYLRHRQNQEDK